MKSKGLTFGVRDQMAMPSAWGLAKVALSGAIANSPARRLKSRCGIGEVSGRNTHKPMSSALPLLAR